MTHKICGMDIVVVPPTKVIKKVKLTWWERLSSIRKIFKRYKEVEEYHNYLENDKVVYAQGKIFVNEATAKALRKEMERI